MSLSFSSIQNKNFLYSSKIWVLIRRYDQFNLDIVLLYAHEIGFNVCLYNYYFIEIHLASERPVLISHLK